MPQKEIKANNWIIDPITGYLTSLDKRHKFTALTKKEFLNQWMVSGDIDTACKKVGIDRRILAPHLRADERFERDYRLTKQLVKDPAKIRKMEVVNRLWAKQTEEQTDVQTND